MGVCYTLVNETKKETIMFLHIGGDKARELAGGAVGSALVIWYMLKNQGDDIQFVSDTDGEWPFDTERQHSLESYTDKTDDMIDALIEEGILQDNGMIFVDEDEPDTVYMRDIVNVWIDPQYPIR